MKKIINLFLWLCTALLLGQIGILSMSAIKGYFNADTLTQIVAILNGSDIQAMRIRNAIISARSLPTPTTQEILDATVRTSLQSDSKLASLDRYKRQLDERSEALKKESERHNALVAEFKRKVDETKATRLQESQQQVREILEAMDPAQAKKQFLLMLEKGKKEDVIAIMMAMDVDKRKKILAEFTDNTDDQKIADLLEQIQKQGKLSDDVGQNPQS